MNNGYTEQIRQRILNAPEGTVFVNSDFADIADNNTVKQSINRLNQEGVLRRIIRGVYDKPKFSYLLEEQLAPDPEAVARALARCFHWTIAPCGDTASRGVAFGCQTLSNALRSGQGYHKRR